MDNMISLIRLDKHNNPAKVKLAAKELVTACSHQTLTHYDDSSLLECVVELEYQELISEVMMLIVSSPSIHDDIISMDSFHENVVKIAGKLGWSSHLSKPSSKGSLIHLFGVKLAPNFWTPCYSLKHLKHRGKCHSLASAIVETIPR